MKIFLNILLLLSVAAFISSGSIPSIESKEKKQDEALLVFPSKPNLRDPRQVRLLLSNDFEDGRLSPWYDESAANVKWKVEDFNSPSEFDTPAPQPSSGTKYLRAARTRDLLSGLAVLRSEPFIASPGDQVTFNFWIRSRRPEGNNLELAMVIGRNETVLLGLSRFSTSTNFEWRDVDPPVQIPVTTPTTIELVIYGYCGGNDEDAIAIDDLVVSSGSLSTTSTSRTTISSGCGGTYTAPSGFISSPNYPGIYSNNLDCRYYINVGSSRANLTISTLSTEPNYDFLEVYDGWDIDNSTLLLRTSGEFYYLNETYFEARGPQMLVRFTTDSSESNYRGFSAFYGRTFFEKSFFSKLMDTIFYGVRMFDQEDEQLTFIEE